MIIIPKWVFSFGSPSDLPIPVLPQCRLDPVTPTLPDEIVLYTFVHLLYHIIPSHVCLRTIAYNNVFSVALKIGELILWMLYWCIFHATILQYKVTYNIIQSSCRIWNAQRYCQFPLRFVWHVHMFYLLHDDEKNPRSPIQFFQAADVGPELPRTLGGESDGNWEIPAANDDFHGLFNED